MHSNSYWVTQRRFGFRSSWAKSLRGVSLQQVGEKIDQDDEIQRSGLIVFPKNSYSCETDRV